ncbi:MAG TPA: hypothetical protein PK789_00480 [Thermomonas sp.]|jgi:hypothetical protein|uniref:hypothetical protein n=1 Tax=Thermomonas sp. TaxID=1971895 RepID=UPI002C52A4FF|nr:hypothetical protein [Thermomonas sp.]HOV95245.1 hypothetical protein [Thermomonas sp.]
MFRLLLRCVLIACLAMLAGCPKSASKGTALDEIQYTWSAAIRWGDFEGAWGLVDPKVREAHPMTDLDFSRFKQVQISTYRDTGSSVLGGEVVRDIEIGVINRNTLAERSVRYRERWRYDEAAKTWWLTSGMPDLWQGE